MELASEPAVLAVLQAKLGDSLIVESLYVSPIIILAAAETRNNITARSLLPSF